MDRKEIYEDVDWTHLSQNKVQLWAFVKMVMNLRVSQEQGIS